MKGNFKMREKGKKKLEIGISKLDTESRKHGKGIPRPDKKGIKRMAKDVSG